MPVFSGNAKGLLSATTRVDVVAATAPTANQLLTATDSTHATWKDPAFTWNNVTETSQAAAINNGYIANNAGLVTVTLPATAVIGSIVCVNGAGAGGWKVAQNANQYIKLGVVTSTTGVGGHVDSGHYGDCIILQCVVANNGWQAWTDSNLDIT